jgi:hypothetical protein
MRGHGGSRPRPRERQDGSCRPLLDRLQRAARLLEPLGGPLHILGADVVLQGGMSRVEGVRGNAAEVGLAAPVDHGCLVAILEVASADPFQLRQVAS